MTCYSKKYLKTQKIEVACGKCHACRINRADMWGVRASHELETSKVGGIFATLTYNNENIPENYSLKKEHIEIYIKRLRQRIFRRKGEKIKYLLAGEYGDLRKRPHYHLIIFNIDFENNLDKIDVEDCWDYGYVDQQRAEYGNSKYTAGYIYKKYIGKVGEEYYKQIKRIPPFQRQSGGIGLLWAIKYKQIIESGNILVNGKKKIAPRYYFRKLELNPEELFRTEIVNMEKEKIKTINKQIEAYNNIKKQKILTIINKKINLDNIDFWKLERFEAREELRKKGIATILRRVTQWKNFSEKIRFDKQVQKNRQQYKKNLEAFIEKNRKPRDFDSD